MAIFTVFPGTNAIQNAVNNLATPGDIILVNEGVYNEAVTITTDNIRLVTANNKVFLDGNNTLENGFTLNGVTGVEINGFNIANYTSDGIDINDSNFNLITRNKITKVNGDGIDLNSGTGNLIFNNTIENIGDDGGDTAIEVSGNTNWIVNNRLLRNSYS